MFNKISNDFGERLKALVNNQRAAPGPAIKPFGDRSIPQALGGDAQDLLAFELLDDLSPCGTALACRLDVTVDPPAPDYADLFQVKDFIGLSGYIGWRGWADPRTVEPDDEESLSDSSDALDIHPLVNLGPACEGSSGSESDSGSESSASGSGGSGGSGGEGSGSEGSDSEGSGSEGSGSEGSGGEGSGSEGSGSERSGSEGSRSEGSGSEGSGSSKDTAVVPASWSPGGFTALAALECPDVRFDEVMTVEVGKKQSSLSIDPKYVEVCERGTIQVCGYSAPDALPYTPGISVEGENLHIHLGKGGPRKVTLTIRLTAIRRSFLNWRFPNRTRDEFESNERRITGK
jgi:hypothetical protein